MDNNRFPNLENDAMDRPSSAQLIASPNHSLDANTSRSVEMLAHTCMDMSPDENIEVSTPKGTESEHQATRFAKLYVALTKVVKKATLEMKQSTGEVLSPIPISSYKIQDEDASVLSATPISSHRIPNQYGNTISSTTEQIPQMWKKKMPSQLIRETRTSFDLPISFDKTDTDLDKMLQSSFTERLKGWKIECRARFCGKCDTYYIYEKADQTFRSIKEVVNFIMFEAYPGGQSLKRYVEPGLKVTFSTKGESSRKKRFKSNFHHHQDELPEEDPVKFLKESYDNLLNFFTRK